MKQTLNKLLFVLVLVLFWIVSPSVVKANTFYFPSGTIVVNVDGSNPAQVTVSYSLLSGGSANLSVFADSDPAVFNRQNTLFTTSPESLPSNGTPVSFDLSGISSGSYYMHIRGDINGTAVNSLNNDTLVSFYLGGGGGGDVTPIVSVNASPNLVPIGGSTTYTWDADPVSGVDSCEEEAYPRFSGRGGIGLTGTVTEDNIQDITGISVECYDINDTFLGYWSANVDVYTPTTPTVTVKANNINPLTVPYNTEVTISWISQNATSCSCTYSGGACGTSTKNNEIQYSPNTYTLTETKTFNVVCNN